MLFSIAHWYISQQTLSQSKRQQLTYLPICENVSNIILEFIYCEKCKTFFYEDSKGANCCCCWILSDIDDIDIHDE